MTPGSGSWRPDVEDRRLALPKRLAWLVAGAFLLQSTILAWAVTPLWDVPDEPAHYAYAWDLAHGRGLPLLGDALVPRQVVTHWTRGIWTEPRHNWAEQHPPLYYLAVAPFVRLGEALPVGAEAAFRVPRVLTALLASAGLLALYRALEEGSGDPWFSLVGVASTAAVPTVSHLASGVTHDPAMLLFGGLAALAWARLVRSGSIRHFGGLVAACAAAGATKLTALPMVAVLVLLGLREVAPAHRRCAAGLSLLAVLPGALWLAVTELVPPVLGRISAHATLNPGAILSYLRDAPLLDETVRNLVGHVGWSGTGAARVEWVQIAGWPYASFAAVGLATVLFAGRWLGRRLVRPGRFRRWRIGLAFTTGAGVLAWLPLAYPESTALPPPQALFLALLAGLPAAGLAVLLPDLPRRERIVFGSLAVVLVFGSAFVLRLVAWSLEYGTPRAFHGRYFFVVLPFLLLGLAWPAWRELDRRVPFFRPAAALVPAGFLAGEIAFFVQTVLPFYRS